MNPQYKQRELEYQVADAGVEILDWAEQCL